MFEFKAKANIDTAAIFARKQKEMNKAQWWLCERVIKDTDQFVPFREGILAGSPRRESDFTTGIIRYATVYARRLYYGVTFKFSRDRHPKATHHWFEKAKSIHLDAWGQGVASLLGGRWRKGA